MKLLILLTFCALQVLNTTAKIIPDYLPQPCSRSQPDYSECTANVIRKLGPYLVKGVEEFNIPKMDPLYVPLLKMNRTVEGVFSYAMVLKDAQFWGLGTTQLESFKFDTQNMDGEVRLNVGYLRMSTEYEASGRSLRYPLSMNMAGYAKGNFTNLGVFVKFSLKKIEKQGVKYYAFEDFEATGSIEGGYLNIVSKSEEDQPFVDFVANFFNKNPKRAVAIAQEDFDAALTEHGRYFAEQILDRVPAQELIPE